jgi:hypothetical protein
LILGRYPSEFGQMLIGSSRALLGNATPLTQKIDGGGAFTHGGRNDRNGCHVAAVPVRLEISLLERTSSEEKLVVRYGLCPPLSFVTIGTHMIRASQSRSCCCLSNIFDGCTS